MTLYKCKECGNILEDIDECDNCIWGCMEELEKEE